MFKLRSSTKVVGGFAILCAVIWVGQNQLQDYLINGTKFPPLVPGTVDIVGIKPKGFHIIIANEVAQLVEGSNGSFGSSDNSADDSSDEGSNDDSDSTKKKISIMDILGVLQGNPESLTSLTMSLNDMSENDLPPIRVIWRKDDLLKAFNGDPVLLKKLEANLNMHLDGSPLTTLNVQSLENGIVVDLPISVPVMRNGVETPVVADMLLPYSPRIMKAVQNDIANKANVTTSMIAGYYGQEAKTVLDKPKNRENIKVALADLISDDNVKKLTDLPKQILSTAFIVVTDGQMTGASYDTHYGADGKPIYNLKIDLNDEGRRRLWQYSRRRVGDQILLTSNGTAIAAARIAHPLFGGEVTISNMHDSDLLDDVVKALKESKSPTTAAK